MSEETNSELIVVEPITALTVFGKEGGSETVIDSIRKQVEGLELDISTEKGRDQIKSVAYKIARTKTALDEQGKILKSEMQKQVDLIDGERKKIRDALDEMKEQVRKPLTDFENAEKLRVSVREERIAIIANLATPLVPDPAAETIQAHLDQLKETEVFDWQEFAMRAQATAEKTRTKLEAMLADRIKRDEEAAELERLRKEKEERERKEREEQIAREAAEAARKEAEEKAAAEAKAAQDKADREKREAEEREAAERKAKEDEIRAAEEAEAKRKAEAEKAEADRKAAAGRAEREKKEAADRAAREERERIEAEKRKSDAEAAAREADKKHKAKINNEVLTALMKAIEGSAGVEATAKAVVVAIASGKVPHTKINYSGVG